MSHYVFVDKEKTIKLFSTNCTSANLRVHYYCPTPNCPAHLTLRSLKGENNPYFAALPTYPHDKNICRIERAPRNNIILDTSNFNVDNLLDSIILKNNITSTPSKSAANSNTNNSVHSSIDIINTVSKLYWYCKNHDIMQNINTSYAVGNIIADSRNNYIFSKGVYGKRLVESIFINYSRKYHIINVNYPVDPKLKNQHTLALKFTNISDFESILSKLFKKENINPSFIVILGECINKSITIYNSKQIAII